MRLLIDDVTLIKSEMITVHVRLSAGAVGPVLPGDSIVGQIDGLAPVTLKIGDAE